jgi:hypothetical protein
MMAKRKKPWAEATFSERIDFVVEHICFHHDNDMEELLKDLEASKELIDGEFEMYQLERVIRTLEYISRFAEEWVQRLTPVNKGWKWYKQIQSPRWWYEEKDNNKYMNM